MIHHPLFGFGVSGSPQWHPSEISQDAMISDKIRLVSLYLHTELDTGPEIRQRSSYACVFHYLASESSGDFDAKELYFISHMFQNIFCVIYIGLYPADPVGEIRYQQQFFLIAEQIGYIGFPCIFSVSFQDIVGGQAIREKILLPQTGDQMI